MLDVNVVRVSDGSFVVRIMSDNGAQEITTHRSLDELTARIRSIFATAAVQAPAPETAQ